jgi:hypothetical protein
MRHKIGHLGREAKEPDACFYARQELTGVLFFPELLAGLWYGELSYFRTEAGSY